MPPTPLRKTSEIVEPPSPARTNSSQSAAPPIALVNPIMSARFSPIPNTPDATTVSQEAIHAQAKPNAADLRNAPQLRNRDCANTGSRRHRIASIVQLQHAPNNVADTGRTLRTRFPDGYC